jgi:hypothetical protein
VSIQNPISTQPETTRRRPPEFMNTLMKTLLRSPFHGLMSKNVMLVTFTGRKTGKQYSTPVSYMPYQGDIVFFTTSRWWQNLDGGKPIVMRIEGRDTRGIAYPTTDRDEILQGAQYYLQQNGVEKARFIGLHDLDTSREPSEAELRQALEKHVMVRVKY